MLASIYIKNFALFEELSVDFDQGLNVISGETGAGKSILINAISLLLATRINKGYIGKFSDETIVEAAFTSTDEVNRILFENSIEIDETIVISRRFTKTTSLIKINGRSINLSLLNEISEKLIDIHGQHSQLIILNKSNYIRIIDSFDESSQSLKNKLSSNIKELTKLQESLLDLSIDQDEVLREKDILSYQINEIQAFDFENFDEEKLTNEHKKLTNLTEIIDGVDYIRSIFSEAYQRKSLKDYINEVYSKLSDLSIYDSSFDDFSSRMIDIREAVNDLSRDIDSYYYSINIDEERLLEIDSIFSKLQILKRKYGPDIADIENFLIKLKDRYSVLENIEENRINIEKDIELLNQENLELADKLHKIREKIIKKLQEAMIVELSQMSMNNLQFKITLDRADAINENGYDQIDFLISTNKGQDMKSLNSVASGGEISRFMLALKAILADSEQVQTIVFDEIDTGISGKTADVVGEKLLKISEKRQLIVITHLPQIASKANSHYLIEKTTDNYMTKSHVYKLDDQKKVLEVARLLSGSDITELSIKSARELINSTKR